MLNAITITMDKWLALMVLSLLSSACRQQITLETPYQDYPLPVETSLWLDYTKESTIFRIWSPLAQDVQLKFFVDGHESEPNEVFKMTKASQGIWQRRVDGDLNGVYYTFQIKHDGQWLNETPGIYAQAVGVNGKRAMVIDLENTNPEGWHSDSGPEISYPNEAIIYELHVRDITIHTESGSSFPGKYLGLSEVGTKGPENIKTGIDHMIELGITHVHLLPSYDHYSINETKLDSAQFNWGYDPQNYNVPEGSFSTDPFNAAVRIKEFKQMVKTFHDNGIGVILDVVYNHTGRNETSNFNLEVPGYYYRIWDDGTWSNASACGNETASERAMMRKFILESVKYWAEEYHIDGFRFDLMGIHDIETMNKVVSTLKEVNPNIFVYGEGWTAGDSPLPEERRALKKHILHMPEITAFSDDIRDGLKGSVFDDNDTGFVSGKTGMEESVKFGIVGSIRHPQIDYSKVNYSDEPWSNEPWQAISYVSCHDNHTIYDKLSISRPDASEEEIVAMNKLANAIVMTSQGLAFLHAGADILRTKNGEHNSFESPDQINQINWNWKVKHEEVFHYYQNLIRLRKAHPAFRMTSAEEVRANLKFIRSEGQVVSFVISNNANGDDWKNIMVIYNANSKSINQNIGGPWLVAADRDEFSFESHRQVSDLVSVPGRSMMVLFQE